MLRKNSLRKLTNSYRWRLKYILLPLLLIGSIVLALWFIFVKSSFFTVKNISVKPDSLLLVSVEDVKRILENKFFNKSIFLSKKELEGMIYANFPVVKSVTTSTSLPDTLIVELKERVPSAYIKTDFQGSYYIADSDGFVLGVSDTLEKDLILINYKGNMVFSGSVLYDDKVLAALHFLEELQKARVEVETCAVDNIVIITTKNPRVEVIIPISSENSVSQKAVLLQKIIQKYSIEGREIKRIDLRFSNPIIAF